MDLNDEATAALREEVALQRQASSLSFVGLPANCAAAVQDMQDQIQVFACHSLVIAPPPSPLSRHKDAACHAGRPVVRHGNFSLLTNQLTYNLLTNPLTYNLLANQLTYDTPPTDKHTAVMLLELCHACNMHQSCHAPRQLNCMQTQR